MIENYTLARPYAKAIFAVALAENSLASWSNFLQTSVKILEEFKRSYVVFNFGLNRRQRLEILKSIDSAFVFPKPENLLKLLLKRKRLRLLPEITFLYEQLRLKHEGILEVKVQTAVALTEAHEKQLAAALQNKFKHKIIFKVTLDPTLIGGAILRMGDQVIDGSVQGMLQRFNRLLA